MRTSRLLAPAGIFLLNLLLASSGFGEESGQVCVYKSGGGKMRTANSLNEIPYRLRKSANCYAKGLAKPDEIKLQGNSAREEISSSLGSIDLRWPRTVERLFGRNPIRAMTDAARTVSRALRTSSFPFEVQDLGQDMKVVFLDENLPESQIPMQLVERCHPGWMTPPNNIYIAAQRVAEGCHGMPSKSSSVADSELAEVIIHELGHVVDYNLLKESFGSSRMRAEGFATWFEIHAARYSSLVSESQLRERTYRLARRSLRESPQMYQFRGSAEDYARASMYFTAIENRRGVQGIIDVYKHMKEEKVPFLKAVKAVMYWDQSKLEEEVAKLLR